MESLGGHLLLASPALKDPNFARAVVLLVQHNSQGALGVILNRPTIKTVAELWKQVGEAPCDCQRPVCLGGPVSGPLMALHRNAELADLRLLPDVFFSADKQHLDRLVALEEPMLKLFIGHAGWSPGQLEQELAAGAWRSLPAEAEWIFDESDDLWERLWQAADASSLASMLKIKHIPPQAGLN